MGKRVQDEDGNWGTWVTSKNGAKIFIREGETIQQAFARYVVDKWDKRDEKASKDSAKKDDIDTYITEDYDKRRIREQDIVGGGYFKKANTEYLKAHGVDDDTLEQMRQLSHKHSGNAEMQKEADTKIVKALESNSKLGQAFKHQIDFEEKLYQKWYDIHKKSDTPWKDKIYADGKRIFRKGKSHDDGVECWTDSEEGADMGYGGIGYDQYTTIEKKLKDGWHILAGISTHWGSPGEQEVTLIKYKKEIR